MSSSRSHFGEAMAGLDRLTAASRARHASNMAKMAMYTRRLDEEHYTPSLAAEASPSNRMPMPSSQEASSEPAGPAGLRDLIPERLNGNGGPYGDAILARVAANYGLDRDPRDR